MRALKVMVLAFLLISSGFWRPLAAQTPVPPSQLALDASLLDGGLSYARATSPGKLVGLGAAWDMSSIVRLVRGENGGKKSTGVAHVEMFTRLQPPGRWQYDLGIKAAAGIHSAKVASEAEVGGFLGGYIAPMWGWPHFRIGPRLQAGACWSPSGPTIGLFVTPLTARFLF